MFDYQLFYKLITIFLYSVFATYIAIFYIVKKSRKFGYTVEDKYKLNNKKIPTIGGIAIFIGVIIALALTQVIMRNDGIGKLFIFYFIVTVYAMYGILDDLFAFKQRYDKILVLMVLSFPIASLITSTYLFGIDFELWYLLLLAPIYIMAVANLVNVYSGFNGLAMGLSLILLITVAVKSYMLFGLHNLIYIIPVLGALLVFLPFNFYPAKLFEGNVGAFLVGSSLGAFLIINKLELFGLFILIPHIINFILDTIVLAILKIPDVKFGEIDKNGYIVAPKSVRFKSLKYILTYYLKLKERNAVLILYIPTIIFCIIGVWLL